MRHRQAHHRHQVSLCPPCCRNPHLLVDRSKFNIFVVEGHRTSNPSFICLNAAVLIKEGSPKKGVMEKTMSQHGNPFRKCSVTKAEYKMACAPNAKPVHMSPCGPSLEENKLPWGASHHPRKSPNLSDSPDSDGTRHCPASPQGPQKDTGRAKRSPS